MSVLVDAQSRILIQGITGETGRSFAERMVQAGVLPPVAGVTPGRGGERVAGVPVFDSVSAAAKATGANVSLVTVPPIAVIEAVWEAAAAGLTLVSVYTENVPVHDAARLIALARERGTRVLGPNSAGAVSPSRANLSDIDDRNTRPGTVGIVSKSGTLTYEVMDGLHQRGLGETSVVCLGGDPVLGTTHADILRLFAADEETQSMVMVGEIGGESEIEAARGWNELGKPKQLVAYIAGHAAPAGRRMGHAGALVSRGRDTAAYKTAALEALGVRVAPLVLDVAELVTLG
ncbi:MAG: succinate--CoA ligase subunit alpha [Candidatus Nephthysia bennettiae]|nr:MAG: succinate--CoA ligase subunit alpha [Candidatus Dormibacteraeota bacterium]